MHTAGSGSVVERDGLWPARKSIYHCEEVGETVGWWQWSYKVHMNVIESALRDAELLKWGFDVCLDLEDWHGMHCFAQIPTCFWRPLHTNLKGMSFRVVCTEG